MALRDYLPVLTCSVTLVLNEPMIYCLDITAENERALRRWWQSSSRYKTKSLAVTPDGMLMKETVSPNICTERWSPTVPAREEVRIIQRAECEQTITSSTFPTAFVWTTKNKVQPPNTLKIFKVQHILYCKISFFFRHNFHVIPAVFKF